MKINVFAKKALTLCLFVIVIACALCVSAAAAGECTNHTSNVWVVDSINAPSCTNNGLKYKVCDNCGEKFDFTVAQALGHVIPEEYVVVEATCQAEGQMTKNCEACGVEIENIKLAVTDHVASDWLKNVKKPVTCTSDGEEYKECVHCKKIMDTKSIAKTGHQMVVNKEIPASCTKDGHTEGKVCASCGLVEVEYEVIPASHKIETLPEVPATKDTEGKTEGKVCSVCGEIIVAQEVIPVVSTLWLNILIIAGCALVIIAIVVLVVVLAVKRSKKIAAAAEALIENVTEEAVAEETKTEEILEAAPEVASEETSDTEETVPVAEETVEVENVEE